MGDFKEQNGKTRIGLYLQKFAPSLLSVAADLTGIKALKKIGEAVSGSNELNPEQKAEALELLKLDLENERERTKRHETDMNSDSWLSKNIRPLVLIYIIFMYTLFSIVDTDQVGLKINPVYITLLGQWGMMVMGFYFTSRGIEKLSEIIGKYQISRKKKNE